MRGFGRPPGLRRNWYGDLTAAYYQLIYQNEVGGSMRLSEFSGKEVINLGDGSRLGTIGECEIIFEAGNGKVIALMLPAKGGILGFMSENRATTIPWSCIKRIGEEIIIVDLDSSQARLSGSVPGIS